VAAAVAEAAAAAAAAAQAAGGSGWLSPGGREFASGILLPLAEAALLPELQRLAVNKAQQATILSHDDSSSSSSAGP
jgi:hypothetical protein